MEERLNLSLTQKQLTTLAPIQLQFVRMLEMNSAEAEDEVARALDDNPALEVAEVPSDDEKAQAEFGETSDQLQRADFKSDEDIPSYRLSAGNGSGTDEQYEPQAVASGESLYEYLLNQLEEDSTLTPRQLEIGRFIVGNIDRNGYMERTVGAIVDDLAIQESIDVSEAEVKDVWNRVRQLDPAGVGAVDLRDSLLLQLRRRPSTPDVELATEIVEHYFDIFSLMHFDRIESLTGSTRQQLQGAMAAIKSLNPKPGALISGDDDDRTRHITPDFYVDSDGDRLSLTMLSHIPRLQIERSFTADSELPARRSTASEAANLFIRQKRDEAAMFIKVVELRRETLYRIMSAIMQWQREFFLTGDRLTMRPMVLKDIAALTGDDISVVSRATAGKYVATAHGVYSLKSLFNERRAEGDDEGSRIKLMHRIRQMVDNEDKSHPLSDDAIAKALAAEGLDIARRTVTKYRERMSIPVGRLRRQI